MTRGTKTTSEVSVTVREDDKNPRIRLEKWKEKKTDHRRRLSVTTASPLRPCLHETTSIRVD